MTFDDGPNEREWPDPVKGKGKGKGKGKQGKGKGQNKGDLSADQEDAHSNEKQRSPEYLGGWKTESRRHVYVSRL